MDKEEGSGSTLTLAEFIAIFLVAMLFLMRLVMMFDIDGAEDSFGYRILGGSDGWFSQLREVLTNIFSIYTVMALTFSTLVLLGLIYVRVRLSQIAAEEEQKLEMPQVSAGAPEMNAKWQKVQAHVNSDNPSEWRLAILEADVMLEEMLEGMSYAGETLGEKLKGVEKSDFRTIDYAWEAHKIRNAIAHEGSDFLVTQREAKRVIGLYERVFSEFYYI